MKALISAPYLVPHMERFRSVFEQNGIAFQVAKVEERLNEQQLLEILPGMDGIIAGDDKLTRRVLEATPSLKVISKWGTGIDSFDLDAAREIGIKVFNVPNAFSEPVSDSIIGYIIALGRNLVRMNTAMKQGVWHKIMGRALNESTVGIIGLGNVGKAVARKLKPFGCRVICNDTRIMTPDETEQYSVESTTLPELLNSADFVVVTCDLNPTSHRLLSDEQFKLMKESAFIVNCARGPIIDQRALVAALHSQAISGAALDVFENEPLESESELRKLPNVLLAPHNSNSSPKAWEATHRAAIRNLFDGLGITDKTGVL